MRPNLSLAAAGLLAVAGCVVVAGSGPAAAAAPACDTGSIISPQDIDADGTSDLVVGVPFAASGAGVVDVHFGADPRTGGFAGTQRFTAARFGLTTSPGDHFGASVSFTEVDGNDCRELAIGAPGMDHGRGAVIIAFGARTGVRADGAIVLHGTSAGEHFGATVRAAMNDVWVSAPDRAVSGHPGAGAVDHFRIGNGTLTLVQRITESSANVPGVAEAYDHFGSVLDVGVPMSMAVAGPDPTVPPRLYAGSPYEDVGPAKDAGAVVALDQSATTGLVTRGLGLSQDAPGVGGHAEPGDHFGAALASEEAGGSAPSRLFVGVPGEGVRSAARAGIVQVFEISSTYQLRQAGTVSQESPGVPGGSETDDRFGTALAISSGCQMNTPGALAIGAPGESIGAARHAGAVTVVASLPSDHQSVPECPAVYRQGAGGVGGSPETGDRFGAAVAEFARPYSAPDFFGHLVGGGGFLVGVPNEDLGGVPDAGAVQGLGGSSAFRDSAGLALEEYGAVLAWTLPNFSCYC